MQILQWRHWSDISCSLNGYGTGSWGCVLRQGTKAPPACSCAASFLTSFIGRCLCIPSQRVLYVQNKVHSLICWSKIFIFLLNLWHLISFYYHSIELCYPTLHISLIATQAWSTPSSRSFLQLCFLWCFGQNSVLQRRSEKQSISPQATSPCGYNDSHGFPSYLLSARLLIHPLGWWVTPQSRLMLLAIIGLVKERRCLPCDR